MPSKIHPTQILQGGATTNDILKWDGTKWAPVAPGAGSRSLIQEFSADSVATTFSFTSIPNTFKGLEIDATFQGTGVGFSMQANASATGYQVQRTGHSNGAINAQVLSATSWDVYVGTLSPMDFRCRLLNYATSATYKLMTANGVYGNTGTGSLAAILTSGSWNSGGAEINRLDVICGAAPVTGFVRLFGLN